MATIRLVISTRNASRYWKKRTDLDAHWN
jgi:hypothetical protein